MGCGGKQGKLMDVILNFDFNRNLIVFFDSFVGKCGLEDSIF